MADDSDVLQKVIDQIISAIEKDIGEPLRYTALTINAVEWNADTNTLTIDYDYERGSDG